MSEIRKNFCLSGLRTSTVCYSILEYNLYSIIIVTAIRKCTRRGKRRGLTVIISDCGAGGPRFKSRARNSFFSRNLKCLSSCCIRGCLNHTAIQKHLLYLLLSPGNIRGCLNHIAIKRRWISSGVLRWQLPKNL